MVVTVDVVVGVASDAERENTAVGLITVVVVVEEEEEEELFLGEEDEIRRGDVGGLAPKSDDGEVVPSSLFFLPDGEDGVGDGGERHTGVPADTVGLWFWWL